ncbi:hypothetical protein MKX01_029818 [Papaver californicum]|nr:hypothetical protein MKX01_029818 [Papaver californicum]
MSSCCSPNTIACGTCYGAIKLSSDWLYYSVVQVLLQSSGLEWFDRIADKSLSEFWFENYGSLVCVYGDQSIADTFHNKADIIPAIDQKTSKLIGCVSVSDIHLLAKDKIFQDRKNMTVKEFINSDTRKTETYSDSKVDNDVHAFFTNGMLRLDNKILPRMDTPATNKKTDMLKQAMKVLVDSKSNRSFLVDESSHVIGMVALRDIIIQFSPPSVDSTINEALFFQSSLEQFGCHVENVKIVRDT